MAKFKFSLLFFIFMFVCVSLSANTSSAYGLRRSTNVVINHKSTSGSYRFATPITTYQIDANLLIIDFGVQPINGFTVTIISVYTEVDYSVTSSFATIPLSVDGVSDYTIVIETDSGDVFEGTLSACDYSF